MSRSYYVPAILAFLVMVAAFVAVALLGKRPEDAMAGHRRGGASGRDRRPRMNRRP